MKAPDQSELETLLPLQRRGETDCLSECARRAIVRYLEDLGDQKPEDLYRLVLAEVERPLLLEMLNWCQGNQSRAADALGINRATLRKKLALYGINPGT